MLRYRIRVVDTATDSVQLDVCAKDYRTDHLPMIYVECDDIGESYYYHISQGHSLYIDWIKE